MWQIDPDPQNMALLDAQPVGSIWPRAAQSVANDLLFLTEVGVRNLGTIGATANMAIGNTGQQVDPLIQAQLTSLANGTALYTSGTAGNDPYASNVSLLLHCDGPNGSTVFTDSSPNSLTMTASGTAQISTANPKFGTGNFYALNTGSVTGGLSTPVVANGPLDFGTGDFTIEAWIQIPSSYGGGNFIAPNYIVGSSSANWLFWNPQSGGAVTSAGPFPGWYLEFQWNGGGPNVSVSAMTTVSLQTWHYATAVRHGTSIMTALDGVFGTSSPILATTAIIAPATMYVAGTEFQPSELDEIRITKGVARYTSNFTPPSLPFGTVIPYDPFSLYYPGRGQYWLFFGAQAFVLTINGMQGTKTWARYTFPQIITDWTLNAGILYLRTINNLVWQLDAGTIGIDDANTVTTAATPTPFNGVVQWPYLDLSSLGLQKMLVGLDIVGTGNCSLQVAFNQNDPSTFNDSATFTTSTGVTTPYFVQIDDTVPGEPLAFPINAASYSPILTFTGSTTSANAWTWQAMNIYFAPTPGNAGGAYG